MSCYPDWNSTVIHDMNILWKYFALWFPMMLIAIANGAARDLLYKSVFEN